MCTVTPDAEASEQLPELSDWSTASPDEEEEAPMDVSDGAAGGEQSPEPTFRDRASTWDPSFKRRQAATGGGRQRQPQQRRRNAWGSTSYADLITRAIESSPDGRLTLAEIYEWMTKNVPYFSCRADAASSAGWKNSVRHNLSLHSKFVRTQNEHTGKSSYWQIDYGASRDRGSYRRRAASGGQLLRQKRLSPASGAKVSKEQEQQQQQQQQQLSVSAVMRDLVSPERLLDRSQSTEQIVIESLTDAVLESLGSSDAGSPEAPVSGLELQLTQLSCQQQQQQQQQQQCEAANVLPGIQEAAEACGD